MSTFGNVPRKQNTAQPAVERAADRAAATGVYANESKSRGLKPAPKKILLSRIYWEEDYSKVYSSLKAMQNNGIVNLHAHFLAHPKSLDRLRCLVKVVATEAKVQNAATLSRPGKSSLGSLNILNGLAQISARESQQMFRDRLIAMANGIKLMRSKMYLKIGKNKLKISVAARIRDYNDLSRVRLSAAVIYCCEPEALDRIITRVRPR